MTQENWKYIQKARSIDKPGYERTLKQEIDRVPKGKIDKEKYRKMTRKAANHIVNTHESGNNKKGKQ